MAITRAQVETDINSASASITFSATPTEGNLLVVSALDRSGTEASSFSISGTGWTQEIAQEIERTNSSYRRTHVVWWKIAGASEPTTISVSGATFTIMAQEFDLDTDGLEATFVEDIVNDNGTTSDEETIDAGSSATSSLASDDYLFIGLFGGRNSSGSFEDLVVVDWATLNLTNNVLANGGNNGRSLASAFLEETGGSGTKNSTADSNPASGRWDNTGLVAGMLVFSLSSGGVLVAKPRANVQPLIRF